MNISSHYFLKSNWTLLLLRMHSFHKIILWVYLLRFYWFFYFYVDLGLAWKILLKNVLTFNLLVFYLQHPKIVATLLLVYNKTFVYKNQNYQPVLTNYYNCCFTYNSLLAVESYKLTKKNLLLLEYYYNKKSSWI